MTELRDIVDITELQADIDAGFIREQFHPEFPYAILNYTEKAQYDNHWTSATLQCRGLIYNWETGEIVARPFPKFFNYSQLTDPPSPDTYLLSVTDKMDGSLGIIYYGPDGSVNVATRGSFTSDQAVWATSWLNQNPNTLGRKNEDFTYLVEIIYAENRIVLSYSYEGLVLLGGVENSSGLIYSVDDIFYSDWTGRRTPTFDYSYLPEVLSAPDRENAEGLVVLTKDNQLIKFKQEDYVKLHRILTGLTERTVYDVLVTDGNVDRLIEIVPDEFHPWVDEVKDRLETEFSDLLSTWGIEYLALTMDLPEGASQKEFALRAVTSGHRAAMFLLHKGDFNKLHEMAWKQIRPEATMATAGVVSDDS